jgi:hypothetical protein
MKTVARPTGRETAAMPLADPGQFDILRHGPG